MTAMNYGISEGGELSEVDGYGVNPQGEIIETDSGGWLSGPSLDAPHPVRGQRCDPCGLTFTTPTAKASHLASNRAHRSGSR